MRPRGFTLVELLVGLAVFGVVLGIIATFFSQQALMNRRIQARNEVQDRVRSAMQLITQDIGMAGSSRVILNGTVTQPSNAAPCSDTYQCLIGVDGGTRDGVYTRYVTSLRDAAQCREVRYKLVGTTLHRDERGCGSPPYTDPLKGTPADTLAADVTHLNIAYFCSDAPPPANPRTVPDACLAGSTQARVARVTLVARSTELMPTEQDQAVLATIDGTAVRCALSRICYALEQDVVVPNRIYTQ